jgi:DNA-binding HxlR family transcriptional regulator
VRSYHQYCGLARALDVIGDRWTMLIVRELAIRECRYRDLRDGLPGIATNLLADRLRQLESDGVIEREEAPPPVGATIYRLSPHGRRLVPILVDLARWGTVWMTQGRGDDEFRGRWLVLAATVLLGQALEGVPDVRIRIEAGDEPVVIEIRRGSMASRLGDRAPVDLTIRATPDAVMGLLSGQLSPRRARRLRVAEIEGPAWAVEALTALGDRAAARFIPERSDDVDDRSLPQSARDR